LHTHTDKNGLLDAQEIHQAITSTGFQVQITAIRAFYSKYTLGKSAMDFGSFILMVITMALIRVRSSASAASASCTHHQAACRASLTAQILPQMVEWRFPTICCWSSSAKQRRARIVLTAAAITTNCTNQSIYIFSSAFLQWWFSVWCRLRALLATLDG